MSAAGETETARWVLGTRVIPQEIERARWRNTLTCRLHPRLSLGVEYNPLAEDVSPLANAVVLPESARRPALVIGTSSDRIGTPHGQSFYATLSKLLDPHFGVPIAPYAGASYGTYEDRLRPIAGATLRWPERWASTALFDGVRGHFLVGVSLGRHDLGLVLARFRRPGATYSVSF